MRGLRTAGIVAVIAGALAGGCSNKGEKRVTISPTCIMVEEAASGIRSITNRLEWCGNEGEINYWVERDIGGWENVIVYARGSLTEPEIYKLQNSWGSVLDLTVDTPDGKALTEIAKKR